MHDTHVAPWERALLALLLIVSLFLRLTALDAFITTDEEHWRFCTQAFNRALSTHDWAGTSPSGHPGVVAMWLGTVGGSLARPLSHMAPLGDLLRPLLGNPAPAPGTGLPMETVAARGLVALVTWLGIAALFPLLRRLFGSRVALVGTALVALDPFYLAHSRLHNLDGLVTTFMFLAMGCLLVYRFRGGSPGYLLASGVATGLALLTKSPGVILVPWAGLVLLAPTLFSPAHKRRRELVDAARILAIWGLVVALVFVVLWPAMWVNPLRTLKYVGDTALFYSETPHENSNYFWFAPRPDPGPFFYPIAWAFRTTPWALLGLAALAGFHRKRDERAPVNLLVVGILLFTLMMTVGDKKFDRYLLPVFPLLDILAAVGWAALGWRWREASTPRWARWSLSAVAPILVVGQFLLLWPTRPYYLSFYNPIFGGGKAAFDVLLMGWGEGLEKAAAYLNAKPNAAEQLVATTSWYSFRDFFQGQTLRFRDVPSLAAPDYYVLYANAVQRTLPDPVSQVLTGRRPEFVVAHCGIEYAWVYPNPLRQDGQEVLAQAAAQASPDGDIILLDMDSMLAEGYQGDVPLQMLDTSGREDILLSALQALVQGHRHVWRLAYPGAGALSQEISQILAQVGTVGAEVTVGSVRALRYDLPEDPNLALLQPKHMSGVRFGDAMTLVGYDLSPAQLTPGKHLRMRLYWQASAPVATSYTVFVQLLDSNGAMMHGQLDSLPQGGARCTDTWPLGEVIPDDHEFLVASDAPPGQYSLLVGMYDLNTMERVPANDPTGSPLPGNAVRLDGLEMLQNTERQQ